MKFTLSWLKEHLDTTASARELADKLTWLGLEVEELSDPGKALSAFTVAEIISADKHPNADRLKLCVVDTGKEKIQVVCGASNARVGLKGVFAPAGTHIPGTGLDLKISSIRGVESRGMLCSEKELQLSAESEGIIELPGDAPLGVKFTDYRGLDDAVFTLNLTPNRGDCAGVRGLARDLAAAGMGKLKPDNIKKIPGQGASAISVKLDPAAACPYFIGRTIKGVKNGPSPEWLQSRLKAIGLKPISALVDITNYLTFDRARPLHVFDAAKLTGGIQVRPAKPGEKLEALDGKSYALDSSITVIADEAKAVAIAGIIGGMETGCTAATTGVFLECAWFDPASIARAGRKLQIRSDARYRFERGVDPAFMEDAVELATRLILDACGGTPSQTVIAGKMPLQLRRIAFRADRCEKLGGLAVKQDEQEKMLKSIGCEVKRAGAGFEVIPPSFRPDMEGEADCVEEILRLKGYGEVPPVPLPPAIPKGFSAYDPVQQRVGRIRRGLAARGMLEALSYSFMDGRLTARMGGASEGLRLKNPISAELDMLRPSILGNLLLAARRNAARGFADAALFEVGPVYIGAGAQEMAAAGVRTGLIKPRQWASSERPADWADAKADALAALEAAGTPPTLLSGIEITAGAPACFHPGRSGVLRLGATLLGPFGEIHPGLLKELDIPHAAAAFEIFPDRLPLPREGSATRPPADLPELQPLTRDFAFVVGREMPADKLLKAVRSADRELIVAAQIFDLYEGKGVPEGQKSLAVAVTLQPRGKSLTDADIEAVSARIKEAAARATGARLRSGISNQ